MVAIQAGAGPSVPTCFLDFESGPSGSPKVRFLPLPSPNVRTSLSLIRGGGGVRKILSKKPVAAMEEATASVTVNGIVKSVNILLFQTET